MSKKIIEYIFVISISILTGITANSTFLLFAIHTPKDTVNLGVTHYFPDYMYYISNFFQGSQGSLLDRGLFTEEYLPPTVLHWPNMLLGAIGGIFHVSPIDAYNISIIVFTSTICVGAYILFKKVFHKPTLASMAFIFFVFSNSLLNKLPPTEPVPYWPFYLWATPHLMFTRFGSVPHYLMQTVLICLIIYILFAKKEALSLTLRRVSAIISIALLTILNPIVSLILLGSYWVTVVFWKSDVDRITTIGFTLSCLISSFCLYQTLAIPPYTNARVWESQQQVTTTFFFLLASIGPIVPFTLIGILSRIRSLTAIEKFGVFLIVGCYMVFLSPIPKWVGISNIRVLFPGLFIFIAWFAATGVTFVASQTAKRIKIKKQLVEALLVIVFLIAVTPTLVWEVQQKIPKPWIYSDELYFMPKSTYKAFTFLAKTGIWSDIVLGNPESHIGTVIPSLSGHKTVYGTEYATIHSEKKLLESLQIYNRITPSDEAKTWFQIHNISYMVCTIHCGDCDAIEQMYPFLSTIFRTETARVYSIKQ